MEILQMLLRKSLDLKHWHFTQKIKKHKPLNPACHCQKLWMRAMADYSHQLIKYYNNRLSNDKSPSKLFLQLRRINFNGVLDNGKPMPIYATPFCNPNNDTYALADATVISQTTDDLLQIMHSINFVRYIYIHIATHYHHSWQNTDIKNIVIGERKKHDWQVLYEIKNHTLSCCRAAIASTRYASVSGWRNWPV